MSLPNYVYHYPALFAEEIVAILTTIENAFALLNYDRHHDELDAVFTDAVDKSGKDYADAVMNEYREHINSVLSLQGITLANPYTDSINHLAILLYSVSLLATQPLSDILHGEQNSIEDTADAYFAKVIALMSSLTVEEVLALVQIVTPELIEFLHQDLPIVEQHSESEELAMLRFKASPLAKDGIACDAIRVLGRFGYDVNTLLITTSYLLSNQYRDSQNAEQLVHELTLLVLGSNTPDDHLLATLCMAAEHIADSASDLVKVNALIIKSIGTPHA